MHHYIYKVTNLITNEFYIGKHSSRKLGDNYMGGGANIKKAIRTYGIENFRKEVIQSFQTSKEAWRAESEVIKSILPDPLCLNIISYEGVNPWFSKYR